MEAATKKAANICDLNDYVILNIFRFLDTQDRIAFAFSCERFRGVFMDDSWVFRRMDLSRRRVFRTERGAINELFRNGQVAQHITELNISNIRVFNWQMDDHLEEFIMLICPHLEALHVLNCGMSLQTLHCILQNAPKLTSLSWSLWDFTLGDFVFIVKSIESRYMQMLSSNSMSSDVKSADEIYLKNIKHLHLEIFPSKPHIQILKYLVLSCCKDIEELEIYTWLVNEVYYTGQMTSLRANQTISCLPQQFISIGELKHLHSLTVVELGSTSFSSLLPRNSYMEEFHNFISSVVRSKSRITKWRKFWISPLIGIDSLQDPFHYTDSLHENHPHEFQSIEEIAASAGNSLNAVDKLKILFQRIDDRTVRSLYLRQPNSTSISDLCVPISRVGGQALKFLSISVDSDDEPPEGITTVYRILFSKSTNITELDLIGCCFAKDICRSLSKLKHLTKVQLRECAIGSKHNINEMEISRANLLTFVKSCKNITLFDVRGCIKHKQFSCHLTDGDLLALGKLRNLESLTLYNIHGIREWTFLRNISENCKILTTLRITAASFNEAHFMILMQSARFLKHLALHVRELDLQSEVFWNLLSYAQNMERLCIRILVDGSINVPLAVGTLMSLPRLHTLHLHFKKNVYGFHSKMIRMLEQENSDRSSFFELAAKVSLSTICKKALPLNIVELCNMTPLLSIPTL